MITEIQRYQKESPWFRIRCKDREIYGGALRFRRIVCGIYPW